MEKVIRRVNEPRVSELMHMKTKIFENKMSNMGLYKGQEFVLFVLKQHIGITQREIANIMRIRPATISVTIKRLEKVGYVVKIKDELDGRKNRIYLTDVGEDVLVIAEKVMLEINEKVMNDFSTEEKVKLNDYIDRMIDNIDDELLSKDD